MVATFKIYLQKKFLMIIFFEYSLGGKPTPTADALKKAVLKSVKELCSPEFSRIAPCELFVNLKNLPNIQDKQTHKTPCAMCDEVNSGPRCMWLCCGFVACQSCAFWYYAYVCPYGVCVACDCPFPTGWKLTDVLLPPSPQADIEKDFKSLQSRLLKARKGALSL